MWITVGNFILDLCVIMCGIWRVAVNHLLTLNITTEDMSMIFLLPHTPAYSNLCGKGSLTIPHWHFIIVGKNKMVAVSKQYGSTLDSGHLFILKKFIMTCNEKLQIRLNDFKV